MNLQSALKEIDIIYVIREKSFTLAYPLEARYDMNNFNVLYLKI